MWIPSIGPEEEDPIEDGLNVGYPIVATLREDPQETATRPDVPVEIEIVDCGDAAAVPIGIVHVFDVV